MEQLRKRTGPQVTKIWLMDLKGIATEWIFEASRETDKEKLKVYNKLIKEIVEYIEKYDN